MIKKINPVIGLEIDCNHVQWRWNRLLMEFDCPVAVPASENFSVEASLMPVYLCKEEFGQALCYHVTDPSVREGILEPLNREGESFPAPEPRKCEISVTRVYPAAGLDMEEQMGNYLVLDLQLPDNMGYLLPGVRLLDPVRDFDIHVRLKEDVWEKGAGTLAAGAGCYAVDGETWNPHYEQFFHGCYEKDGEQVFYEVRYPENPQHGKKYPLIVVTAGAKYNYNGGNRGAQAATVTVVKLARQLPNAILLIPQLHFGYSWVPDGGPAVAMLKDFISHTELVDPRRIYITGQSAGSVATWAYLQFCPELFACAMPGSGGLRYRGMNMNDLKPGQLEECLTPIAEAETPVFIHHGASDRSAFFYESGEVIALLQQLYRDKGKTLEEIERLVPVQIYTAKRYGSFSGHSICEVMYSEENVEKMMSYTRE